MIKEISSPHNNVAAFELSGKIDKEQFDEVVIPRVNALVEKIDEINLLYLLNTDLGNFTAGAWWKDAMLGLGNITKWNKSAIVTNSESIQKFTDMFSVVMPGEFRGFDKDQLEEALDWIAS